MACISINKSIRKSKRRRFPISFKLNCINQFEKSKNLSKTAVINGIQRSTLRNWVKFKTLLLNVCNKSNFSY